MQQQYPTSMDALTIALVLLGSASIGFLFAPLGLGGGLLFAPLLHYGAGWEIDGALLIVSLGFLHGGNGSILTPIEKQCSLLIRSMFYETGWHS